MPLVRAGGDGLAVAVVEQGLVAGLGEAVGLEVEGLLEAVLVGFEVEGAGEEVGVVDERLWRRREERGAWWRGSFSMRACSKPASMRSCEARTKTPGRPRTAERRVVKSPPVSGARKRMTCWASSGTVMVTPSSRTFLFQVWISVNQLSGGGLVVPRRKAATRR